MGDEGAPLTRRDPRTGAAPSPLGDAAAPDATVHAASPRFNRMWMGVLLIYVAVAVTLNVAIDPHDTFPALHLARFDARRHHTSRIAIGNRLAREGIGFAVLGSSRAQQALVAPPPGTPHASFYNAALSNTSIAEMHAAAEALLAHNRPRTIVLGLEFDVFNAARFVDIFHKSLLDPAQTPIEVAVEQAISTTTLETSLDMLADEPHEPPLSMREKFETLLGTSVRLARDVPVPPRFPRERYEHLRRIRELAEARGSELIVVILPPHASMLSLWFELGQGPAFRRWRHDVLTTLEGRVPVWDFTSFGGGPAEPVPSVEAPERPMRWFTDASHCSPAFGDLVMRRISGDPQVSIGRRLTLENEDRVEEELTRGRRDYYAEHPAVVAWVRRQLHAARREP